MKLKKENSNVNESDWRKGPWINVGYLSLFYSVLWGQNQNQNQNLVETTVIKWYCCSYHHLSGPIKQRLDEIQPSLYERRGGWEANLGSCLGPNWHFWLIITWWYHGCYPSAFHFGLLPTKILDPSPSDFVQVFSWARLGQYVHDRSPPSNIGHIAKTWPSQYLTL